MRWVRGRGKARARIRVRVGVRVRAGVRGRARVISPHLVGVDEHELEGGEVDQVQPLLVRGTVRVRVRIW